MYTAKDDRFLFLRNSFPGSVAVIANYNNDDIGEGDTSFSMSASSSNDSEDEREQQIHQQMQ